MPCTVIFASGSIPMDTPAIVSFFYIFYPGFSAPFAVPMTCYDGPHEPDHPSTRAIDYDCIHCQSNVFVPLYNKDGQIFPQSHCEGAWFLCQEGNNRGSDGSFVH